MGCDSGPVLRRVLFLKSSLFIRRVVNPTRHSPSFNKLYFASPLWLISGSSKFCFHTSMSRFHELDCSAQTWGFWTIECMNGRHCYPPYFLLSGCAILNESRAGNKNLIPIPGLRYPEEVRSVSEPSHVNLFCLCFDDSLGSKTTNLDCGTNQLLPGTATSSWFESTGHCDALWKSPQYYIVRCFPLQNCLSTVCRPWLVIPLRICLLFIIIS